jgi:6-phosphogluconolactonase
VRQTVVYEDAEALSHGAAELALSRMAAGLETRGRALIVLSGGRTPEMFLRLLAAGIAKNRVPAEKLLWIFADERWVGISHPDSNEGMARRLLLDAIGAPEGTILSWRAGSGDPVESGARYADLIRSAAGTEDAPDLCMLGIGADGHTASLFPGAVLRLPGGVSLPVGPDVTARSAAVLVGPGTWRLTLCPSYLNSSRTTAFLVAGADKRGSLRRSWKRSPDTPASWIRGYDTIYMTTRETLDGAPPDFGGDVRFV